jgi:hypothetical protein
MWPNTFQVFDLGVKLCCWPGIQWRRDLTGGVHSPHRRTVIALCSFSMRPTTVTFADANSMHDDGSESVKWFIGDLHRFHANPVRS